MKLIYLTLASTLALLMSCSSGSSKNPPESKIIDIGDRPAALASLLRNSLLKDRFIQCDLNGLDRSELSISHRGAPLQFAEHTREGYIAAVQQGAAVLECDVTFTRDRELVCRHSQCDLHLTTNILATGLADRCRIPPDPNSTTPYANVECCTSDITLAEFRTLKGKRDGGDSSAATLESYLEGTPGWSGNGESDYGELLSHQDSISLFNKLGVSMTPELKAAQVPMPYQGDYSQEVYAAQMINEYSNAGIEPSRVFPQSFNLEDIRQWLQTVPEFGHQAVYLDGRYRDTAFDINDANSWSPTMDSLVADGIRYLASPIWMLLALDSENEIEPSEYALSAKMAGLNLLAWTVERSGPIATGDNWFYQSIQPAITSEGDVLKVIDALVQQVEVSGIYSDWPATVTYYSHCSN